jgi:hypothetical protein
MDQEIKKPTLRQPQFHDEAYDFRNIENAGHFRGVGQRGKTGSFKSTSLDAMPENPTEMREYRDHRG